jgi:hypothetical protein
MFCVPGSNVRSPVVRRNLSQPSPTPGTAVKPSPFGKQLFLWILSLLLTLICLLYQDKTGPTYPLEGNYESGGGPVHFKCLRSETIGNDLSIVLCDPLPEGTTGTVRYRRYKSHDDWSSVTMMRGEFSYTRRGQSEVLSGIGVKLPGLNERAGKYEYFVLIGDRTGTTASITGDSAIMARYKADVPMWALAIHILVIFASMMLAIRTMFAAATNAAYMKLLWSTVISLLLGGFVLGPVVQWYAFGVWWSGIPFGYDWTDNKVLVELAFWLWALYMNRGGRKHRASVYVAGIATLIVYFIPHSIFGSEYNYTTGSGHGTAG